ncbi:hypothetical protein OIV83_002773 [Microbotryomycetes sp. JL201]|nr:hypothetical protein OIV83_002773 [Microbotryomycetes sp. JL201]
MATVTKTSQSSSVTPRKTLSKATVSYPVLQASSTAALPGFGVSESEWGIRALTTLAQESDSPPATPIVGLGLELHRVDSDDSFLDPLHQDRFSWWTDAVNGAARSASQRSIGPPMVGQTDDLRQGTGESALESKFSATTASSAVQSCASSEEGIDATEQQQQQQQQSIGFDSGACGIQEEDVFSSPSFASATLSPVSTMNTYLSPASTSMTFNSPPSPSTPGAAARPPAFSFARTPPLTLPDLPPTPDASQHSAPPLSMDHSIPCQCAEPLRVDQAELIDSKPTTDNPRNILNGDTVPLSGTVRAGDALQWEIDQDDLFHPCNFYQVVHPSRDSARSSEVIWLDDVDSSDQGDDERQGGCSDVDLDFDSPSRDQAKQVSAETASGNNLDHACEPEAVSRSESSSFWACRG